MKNNSQSNQSPKDLIKFENELLKMKLQVEFGMEQSNTSELSPELENAWLNNIYDFEQQFKNARRIKVFDVLGRPECRKFDKLSSQDVPVALDNLTSLMEEKGIALDCCSDYDDATIYRFITEELFECEMDDISIKGMVHHFIYEEFHPNHEQDLRSASEQFSRNLLEKKWHPEFDSYTLADCIALNSKEYSKTDMTSIIFAFQEDREFEIERFDVVDVKFDLETGTASVNGHIRYGAKSKELDQVFDGPFLFLYMLDLGYWHISGLRFPGI